MKEYINNFGDVSVLGRLQKFLMYVLRAYEVYVEKNKMGNQKTDFKLSVFRKVEKPMCPYQLDKITIDNEVYFLKQKVSADVEFKEGLFYIVYPDLKIVVWGETREEAEEAFDFIFRRLIVNIYLNKNVSLKTQALKSILNDIIKSK